MALTNGTRIGSYEVTGTLGAGGMGEVYQARDTRLKRDVALKILPESFATDSERLARFQREAEVLASLNHPNIAAIYGLEESNGIRALVMELVDGPTLADRIAQGAIPVDEALPIAKQIAEALEAAHERGVIHRDLKPANIKVRPDGTVKVLDFGLAKALESTVISPNLSDSPTITSPAMTQRGVILGTAAYMSPEQARGKTVDKRSDIWAFGCVLYEMLTGRSPFAGGDAAEIMSAVLRIEPDWTALPNALPPAVAALSRGCLVKNARERISDFSTVRFIIANADVIGMEKTEHRRSGRRSMVLGVVIAAAVILVALGVVSLTRAVPVGLHVVRTALVLAGKTAPGGAPGAMAITPDGSRIVYSGDAGTQIFVRAIDMFEPVAIASGKNLEALTVSPDGQSVVFFDNISTGRGVLKKVAITGGSTSVLAEVTGDVRGLAWGEDDSILLGRGTGIYRMAARGGEPVALTKLDEANGERDHLWPQFLPGGQTALFTVVRGTRDATGAQVATLDLQTGTRRVLIDGGSDARFVSPGFIIYGNEDTLFAVTFDARGLEISGSPVPVLAGVARNNDLGFNVDIAENGTLAYLGAGAEAGRVSPRTLAWVDRNGHEEVIPAPIRAYAFPRLSPDGTMVALHSADEENDLWMWHFTRHTLTRLTVNRQLDWAPLWNSDGNSLYFSSTPPNALAPGIAVLSPAGSGPPRILTQTRLQEVPTGITPDGMRLVYTHQTTNEGRDLHLLTLGDPPRAEPLMATQFEERNGVVSPNGRWLAYASDNSGQLEVYVRPFPDVNRGLWQVSTAGGDQPAWALDTGELFYGTPDGAIMAVRPEASESTWNAGPPTQIVSSGYFTGRPFFVSRQYDVTRDGRRFIVIKEAVPTDPQALSIALIQNWTEELKRFVPTN